MSFGTNYILNERDEPVICPLLIVWALWMAANRLGARRVARWVANDVEVSTVFLGIDHNFGDGPAILWETMVFKDGESVDQRRCSGSREQALAMHEEMVEAVKALDRIQKRGWLP